jgi:hypothetical protein
MLLRKRVWNCDLKHNMVDLADCKEAIDSNKGWFYGEVHPFVEARTDMLLEFRQALDGRMHPMFVKRWRK